MNTKREAKAKQFLFDSKQVDNAKLYKFIKRNVNVFFVSRHFLSNLEFILSIGNETFFLSNYSSYSLEKTLYRIVYTYFQA